MTYLLLVAIGIVLGALTAYVDHRLTHLYPRGEKPQP